MSAIKFSTGLFEQLGATTYVTRPAYFQKHDYSGSVKQLEDPTVVSPDMPVMDSEKPIDNDSVSSVESTELVESSARMKQAVSIVLIGAGLNSIWEDESKLEWQLLQNISQAFGWSEDEIGFYDTDALISEEAVFATMEEVIDFGVEWVLSMDSEHVITEQLSEGVQVVEVPDLEQMLSDPYAKQSFYQSVSPLVLSA